MKTRFLKDVKSHKMTILKDDGVYRHVRFKRVGESAYYFDLVTYPNHLVVSGDMGDYVFSRTNDMFNFFSTKDNKLNINFSYWTEKIIAMPKGDLVKEYCAKETFSCLKENGWLAELKRDQRVEFKHEILETSTDQEAHDIMQSYEVYDAYECISYKPTFHSQWILYAIKWGILKYQKEKEKQEAKSKKKFKEEFLNA